MPLRAAANLERMERGDDGLLEGIDDGHATSAPAGFIAAILVLEAAVLIVTVLARLGVL